MLHLASTDTLQLVTANAVSAIDSLVSWENSSGDRFGRQADAVLTAVTTAICAAPPLDNIRIVKTINVRNKAAVPNVVTLQLAQAGGPTIQLLQVNLLPGNSIQYNEGDGFGVVDAAGAPVSTPSAGRLLGTSLLTAAAANFTTGPETRTIKLRGLGGGGGGGGCALSAAGVEAAAAGGGGSGGYAERTFAVTPNTAYAYTCGPGGAGALGAAGINGTDSTFGPVGGVTVTAPGGGGAPAVTPNIAPTTGPGGAPGALATFGDVNSGGAPGDYGAILVVATITGTSGDGGDAQIGGAGAGISAVGDGAPATGFGAGGSGSMTGIGAARTGGNGAPGAWIVEEYS